MNEDDLLIFINRAYFTAHNNAINAPSDVIEAHNYGQCTAYDEVRRWLLRYAPLTTTNNESKKDS